VKILFLITLEYIQNVSVERTIERTCEKTG